MGEGVNKVNNIANTEKEAETGKGVKVSKVVKLALLLGICFMCVACTPAGEVPSSADIPSSASSSVSPEESNSSAPEVTPENAPESEEMRQAKLYLEKISEYQEKYGEGNCEETADGGVLQTNGLALAALIDFDNNGADELLLAYFDPSSNLDGWAFNSPEGYKLEVWQDVGSMLTRVYEGTVRSSNGGVSYIELDVKDTTRIVELTHGTSVVGDDAEIVSVLELGQQGFQPVQMLVSANQYGPAEEQAYAINDIEVSYEEYTEALDEFIFGDVKRTQYWLSYFIQNNGTPLEGYTQFTPEELIEITTSTIMELRSIAGEDVLVEEEKEPTQQSSDVQGASVGFPKTFLLTREGAWDAYIQVEEDGSFIGVAYERMYGATGEENPKGTVFDTSYSGKFTIEEKVSDTEYRLRFENFKEDEDEEQVIDGVLHKKLAASNFGLEEKGMDEWVLYLPGQNTNGLPEEFLQWYVPWAINGVPETFDICALRNVTTNEGWYEQAGATLQASDAFDDAQ